VPNLVTPAQTLWAQVGGPKHLEDTGSPFRWGVVDIVQASPSPICCHANWGHFRSNSMCILMKICRKIYGPKHATFQGRSRSSIPTWINHHHHHHHQILLWCPSTSAQERLTTQITIKRSIKYIKMKKLVVIISVNTLI